MNLNAEQRYTFYNAESLSYGSINKTGREIIKNYKNIDLLIADDETGYLRYCPIGSRNLIEPEKKYSTIEAIKLVIEEGKEFHYLKESGEKSDMYILRFNKQYTNYGIFYNTGDILRCTPSNMRLEWVERKSKPE